jgi:hypothetical protein
MTDRQPGEIVARLPGIEATYRQVPGQRVWHIADWWMEQPLPQKITPARLRKILKAAQCGLPREVSLGNLAAAVEVIRRQTVVAKAIKAELEKRQHQKRRVIDAVALLRRHVRAKIERWERADADASQAAARAVREGALPDQFLEGRVVTDARELLAGLDRFPDIGPPPRLAEPWHDAAIQLACIFVAAFGARNEPPAWYVKGPGVAFVQMAINEIGCGSPTPDAIAKVIRRAGL